MKQLVILSGKGGTGKTSLTAAFADLAAQNAHSVQKVLVDADVDAANLELVLQTDPQEEHSFTGGSVAMIDMDLCAGCGTCQEVCRFDAILDVRGENGPAFRVDPIACDGCAACVYQCPQEAIHMETQHAGFWYRSESRYGPVFHAQLFPAQENSGKLVTLIKQQARLYALDRDIPLILVDGPPGIGCPVISAVSGADLALIVAEPTVSGIHDMSRALEMSGCFHVPALVVINKADIYPQGTRQIETFCRENAVPLLGHIPFDETVTEAMLQGEPVTRFSPSSPASQALGLIWRKAVEHLDFQEAVP